MAANTNRRLNFSVQERNILLRLIEENIDIVESKKNDGLTVRKKDEAWARIVTRFNSENAVIVRTHRQLRKYWNNLKMRAKKSVSCNGYANVTLPTSKSPHAAARTPRKGTPHPRARARLRSYPSGGGSSLVFSQPQFRNKRVVFPGVNTPQEQRAESEAHESPAEVEGSLDERDEGQLFVGPGRGSEELENGEYCGEEVHHPDDDDVGEFFQCVDGKVFKQETTVGMTDDIKGDHDWTPAGDDDFARREHEAKLTLLTIQIETAQEQRELAREMREQTRQRHRLEMELLEDKKRYRTMKTEALRQVEDSQENDL